MHSRIRFVGGICFGAVAVMCTVIPLLLAQKGQDLLRRRLSPRLTAWKLKSIASKQMPWSGWRSVPDNQVQQLLPGRPQHD